MSATEQHALLVVLCIAVLAPVLADLVPRIRLPVVVLEISLGILVGPQVLAWAQPGPIVTELGRFGMLSLFFLAGMELDLRAIRGRPLVTASVGWGLSVGIALGFGWALRAAGMVVSDLVFGLALTTTALGALIPILRDAGEGGTKFGTFVVAAGAAGEFGPIVLISLLLTTEEQGSARWTSGLLLITFTAIAVTAAIIAARARPLYLVGVLQRKLHTSAQLPVRVAVLLLAAAVILLHRFGLDAVLGAIAAGVVVSLTCQGHYGESVRHKLEAIGFGFFVPIFFVVSGIKFDLRALTQSGTVLLRVPLLLLLMLIARGVPVVLCRRDLPRGDLVPLALLSATALPLIVAITEVGVETGRMKPESAAALVGAGMVSMLLFPLLALSLRKPGTTAAADDESAKSV
jgi:Kef-type K+ transport system membrane component KefB